MVILDRVFKGNDMMIDGVIQIIDHTGQTGRLTATGRPRHQKQTARPHDQITNNHRKTELLERQEFVGNPPQDHPDVTSLLENSNSKTGFITEGKPEVGPTDFLQFLLISFRADTFHQADGVFGGQRLGFEANHMTAQA